MHNNAAFNQVWKLILHWRVIMGTLGLKGDFVVMHVKEFRCSCFHLSQRSQPFVQRRDTQRRQLPFQRRPNRQMDSQKIHGPVPHRPFQLRRKWWLFYFFHITKNFKWTKSTMLA